MSGVRPLWIVVALACLLPLTFAGFTGHVWEDYFITLRSSRNLVEGHGLVFTPGERVHTFTSPLGVLLPALCKLVAGPANEAAAMWLFRLLSVAFLAAGFALVWRRFDRLGVGAFGRVVFFGLLLADAKLTDFATNGMETALLVFFLLLLWAELERNEGPRVLALAVACAGLMWTRPDGFIPGAALIIPHVIFRPRGRAVPIPWAPLVRGILLGALIYLPWFLWAWSYYGSPVPHTIIAKAGLSPRLSVQDFLLLPWHSLMGRTLLIDLFTPTYWFYGGWPTAVRGLSYVLSLGAAFLWLLPRVPLTARRVSFAVFIGMFYICAIILFPWYAPPWAALATLAVALSLDAVYVRARASNQKSVAALLRISCAAAVVFQAAVLLATAWQMRTQQRIIEHGVRRAIGEWLHANAARGDSVLLEPLGYIGYYSRLKTYDMPGLSSPEVAALIRGGVKRYADLIAHLKPTWLVLRPTEIATHDFATRPILRDYQLVRSWNALPELDAVGILPGRKWLEWDARFHVYRYAPAGPASPRQEAPPPAR